jgi:hypothetical protein
VKHDGLYREASLTFLGYGLIGYRLIPFAKITVAIPAQDNYPILVGMFTLQLRGPFGGDDLVRISASLTLCTASSLRTFPLQSFSCSIVGKQYTVWIRLCQEKFPCYGCFKIVRTYAVEQGIGNVMDWLHQSITPPHFPEKRNS